MSFLIVSFGQSSWIPFCGIGAAAIGYACFWNAMLRLFSTTLARFWLSVGWFALVQAVQLSWLTSTQYMGPLILVVYGILIFLIGLQFGSLVFFFRGTSISLQNCFALSGCWVILEWLRTFFFTGFTWNPVGLALADTSYAIQLASLLGVYGLSFWVIFVNSLALYVLEKFRKFKDKKQPLIWISLACFPYLFGFCQIAWVEKNVPIEKVYSIALVQTAILPEQKDRLNNQLEDFIPPLNQWERIWECLEGAKNLDFIILPEAAVSLSAYRPFYPIDLLKKVWGLYFGKQSLEDLPSLTPPFAVLGEYRGEKVFKVSNAFIAQAMANHFKSNVIAGFDDQDESLKYNAAFCFKPNNVPVERYEKRILVPIGEYTPFSQFRWVSDFLSREFGIGDSFDIGAEAKIFSTETPVGVSICLEETYSHLIRDLRLSGARLFINISNDIWFPHSRLPEHHFQHGKIRAVENGVCVLRSCNTGITGAIDCCGRVVQTLIPSEKEAGILTLSMPVRSFKTLYTWWGNLPILLMSFFFFGYIFRKYGKQEALSQ